jgi:hypothetical protein
MTAPTNVPAQQGEFSADPMGFGDAAQQRADAEAQANGVATTTKTRNSYWGTDVTFKWFLPGEDENDPDAQYIEYKKMNEGDRSKYQKAISDPVLVHRGSGDARMKVDPARDREALLNAAVSGWNLWKGDRQATFNPTQFNLWKNAFDPASIDRLEKAIRKVNPWLRNEMSLKDAREEHQRLADLIVELEDEEQEKLNSSSK